MNIPSKGFVAPLLLILLAVLLVGGGVYAYMHNKQGTSTTDTANQATSTAQTSNSQPDNWITYKDTDYYTNKFTYSFDLPAAWRVYLLPDYSQQIFSSPTDNGVTYDNNEIVVDVALMATDNTQEIKAWCEQSISHQEWGLVFANGYYLTLDGEKAYSVDYHYKDPSTWSARRICIAIGNKKYVLEGSPADSRFMPSFDRLVKSFQFAK